MGKNVESQVNLLTMLMGQRDPLVHLFKSEIICSAPEAERFSADIDRIRPVVNGEAELLQVPCRDKEFRDFDFGTIQRFAPFL